MNYLGHIFLSGENDLLMVGNFIGDYVKGKKYQLYPEEIQRGILLHRAIDAFTDSNEQWRTIKKVIFPLYQRYSGIVADLFIDHFLAAEWERYSTTPLPWFMKRVHATFLQNYDYLPEIVQGFLAYFIQHRRLLSYASISGVHESLYIMSLRSSLPEKPDDAIDLLQTRYEDFYRLSHLFLGEVTHYVGQQAGIDLAPSQTGEL